ncbi:ed00d3e9-972d-494f-9345-c8a0491df1cb [Thermothielavioides terrestris]|uniref:Ed00d3e9-972d-494f-9345-c8a0491df1cb n=1 Tax=Thermothielavioides terrestris TaxID=2587410 RepID=A0A446BBN4_9PEZI|nr:ed00d3e9-972d-494f-9345-c8a0491df1cb [Thermothielavioides terrestris]
MADHENEIIKCRFWNCAKQFETAEELRDHIAEDHPGDNVCEHCGQAFLDKGSQAFHKKKHDAPTAFKCFIDGCDHAYWRADSLGTHLLSKHGELIRQAVDQFQRAKRHRSQGGKTVPGYKLFN